MELFMELFLIGVGLSMDAFAVSVCKGLGMSKVNKKQTLLIGLFFGGFQAFMPFVGWVLGTQFKQYITAFDHWVAFILLSFIGSKMIWEVFHPDEDMEEGKDQPFSLKELLMLAIATSIDALAVGIIFALQQYPIVEAISIIGVVTFVLSVLGVYIGNFFGSRYKNKAELAGGIILIGIGLKILLEHLGVFG